MDTAGVIQLCILVVLIMLSAFFSSAETALTTLSLVKVRSMAEENPTKKVLTLQKILDKKSKLISAILIGNNIVNISASSLMTSLVIRIWGNAAVGIATGVLTLLILLFGEIVPKTWAMYNNENLALAYSSPIYFLMQVLTPIIFIIDKLSGFLLKLLSVVFGSILYYLVLQIVIWMGIDTDLLKMLSALVVAFFLAFPYWKGKYFTKAKQGGK